MKYNKFLLYILIPTLFFGLMLSQNKNIYKDVEIKGKNNVPFNLPVSSQFGVEWNQIYGAGGLDIATDVIVDSLNNIYVTGGLDLNGTISLFLLKYNSAGDLEWDRTTNLGGFAMGYDLAFDSLNNIYVVGFGYVPLIFSYPTIVLWKYNSDGVLDWYKKYDIGEPSSGAGIAIDSSDNFYMTGQTMPLMGDSDIFIMKCNSLGISQWNYTWGGGFDDLAYRLVLDSTNNIYIAATVDWASPNSDICLLKYNNSGNKEWDVIRDGGEADRSWGIALDSSENIYLSGMTTISGNSDMCVVKFDKNGNYQWNRTWGGSKVDGGYGIAIDSDDNIYLGGNLDERGIYSNISLISYNSSGNYQWNATWGGLNQERCTSIALDSSEENIYLAGSTDILGTNDSLVLKYNLKEPITDGNGEELIPGYNTVLIIAINCCVLVYFIKKRWKEKE